jgi:hypothetical protein
MSLWDSSGLQLQLELAHAETQHLGQYGLDDLADQDRLAADVTPSAQTLPKLGHIVAAA